MRALVQRVSRASVTVAGDVVGAIGRGLLVFVGVERGDGPDQAEAVASKLATLRIFADAQGRMNLDVSEAAGAVLVVSQFTLAGSIRKGRRPSFDGAEEPAAAARLVELVVASLRSRGLVVQTGRFGADMAVELINEGPVTFLYDAAPTEASPAASH